MSRVLFKVQLLIVHSTIKQARLNSIMLLSKYEDMLDRLDLNSVAKARQINLQFMITATLNYKFSNKCDRACENRAYLHTKFSLIFELQFTISFEVQMP